jgi:hypothetical protein
MKQYHVKLHLQAEACFQIFGLDHHRSSLQRTKLDIESSRAGTLDAPRLSNLHVDVRKVQRAQC